MKQKPIVLKMLVKMPEQINTCFFCKRDISSHSQSELIECVKGICRISLGVGS